MEPIQLATFGDVLKARRKQKRLTQRQLAERLGVHYNTIWAWERGDYLPETKGMVLELARQLALDDGETRQLLESSLTSLSSHWNVPYQRNRYFTGRETLLHQIYRLLSPTQEVDSSHALALSGLGGIGKTQAAIEYAYRHAQEYTAIFWLYAETTEHLRADLIALADLLELPERQEQDQSRIVRAVQRWLSTHRDWLLIIDNVQEIEAVKELLPATRRGSLLFTTRLPTLGTLAQMLRLERMNWEEGVQLLLRRSGQLSPQAPVHTLQDTVTEQEYAAARHLFTTMDGLPLALDQAGAYIEKTQSSLSDFLGLFQRYPLRLLHARESYDEHPISVAKTFLLAFERLQATNPLAADLLTAYCMLPLDSIPEELITEGSTYLGSQLSLLSQDELLYHQVLQDLLAYSFLRRLPETKCISVHRLVQLVIREQLETEDQRQWATHLLLAAHAIFPPWEHTVIPSDNLEPRNQRLLPLVFACEKLVEQYQINIPEVLRLLARAAHYLRLRGQYQQAEALCLQAMELNQAISGSDQIETAMILCVYETIHYDLGRYEEAQELGQRAVALYEQFLGPEHPVTIDAANFLASLLRLCGRNREAEVLFLRTLAFYERERMEVEMAPPLFGLANLYLAEKQFEKAEPLFQRVLVIRERELGPDHFHTGTALNGLARFYTECGRYKEAESFYERALTTYEHSLGLEHPYVAVVLLRFGQLCFLQQRYTQAEALYQRCLALQERVYSPEHIHFITLLTQIGQLFIAQERYSEARENLQRALSIAERALAPEHEQIAEIRSELSRLETR